MHPIPDMMRRLRVGLCPSGASSVRGRVLAAASACRPRANEWRVLLLLIGSLTLVSGCSSTRGPAVPPALTAKATVPGFSGVRLAMDPTQVSTPDMDLWLTPVAEQIRSRSGPLNLLALSGGGPDGAYGVGVLNGWSRTGTRPDFDVVTGISTGSLIAPFAFLGEAYDEALKEAYTTISDDQVFRRRRLLGMVFNGLSAADSRPLYETLLKQFDEMRLAAIAAEHRKGRRLYVGTSDLDAEVLICWDLGAVAASGQAGARELFCRVLLASASIPVAFPPVLFDVEAEGRTYQEMHGDGGCMTQVFGFYFLSRLQELSGRSGGRLFVIRNQVLASHWEQVSPELIRIGGRAVSLLMRNQGMGDLYRAYLVAAETGLDFHLAYVPGSFEFPNRKGEFDPAYMKALFDVGFDAAKSGTVWFKQPPAVHLLHGDRAREPGPAPSLTSSP